MTNVELIELINEYDRIINAAVHTTTKHGSKVRLILNRDWQELVRVSRENRKKELNDGEE